MILSRVIEHVKKQHWTAVFLDFVIVVMGVFIGLQVQDWNTARLDAQETKTVLARLEQDFELQLSYTKQQTKTAREAIAASGRLIRGIRAGKLDEKSLAKDSNDCIHVSALPGPSSTFQELVSSGRMELIRDEDLRSELYAYNSYITLLRNAFPIVIEPLYALQRELIKVQSVSATGEPVPSFAQLGRIDSVDGAAILDDRPLYDALQVNYVTQDNIHLILLSTATKMEHILALLKKAQGRDS